MDWRDILPGVIGSFVGVMGWLVVGIYIQRRQFLRQARNAAKAVYFELDVNRSTVAVAREHGLFADLNRSSFERLLPELATLLAAPELRNVVDAYKTQAGYRQLASNNDLPDEIRRAALSSFADAHDRAIATLRSCAFSDAEKRAMGVPATAGARHEAAADKSSVRAKP